MKILYLAPEVNIFLQQSGGAGTHMRATIGHLSKSHDVTVAIGGDLMENHRAEKSGQKSEATSPGWKSWVPKELKKTYADHQRKALNKAIFQKTLELIHQAGIPDIIYERSGYGYDVGYRLSKSLGVPLVLESDVLILELMAPDTSWLFNRIWYRNMEYKKIHQASSIVVMSPFSVTLMKEKWGLDHDRVFYKSLGIDLRNLQKLPNRDLDQQYGLKGAYVAGYVGIFQDYQHIPVMLEAARLAKDPQIRFMLVGSGKRMPDYQSFVREHQLDQVIFTGLVDKNEIGNYYDRIDLGVIPDCAYHMYPVKYLEFWALGIPTITPNYEVFRPFYAGTEEFEAMTFEPRSPQSLLERLEAVKAMKEKAPGRLRAIIQHTQSKVMAEHTWEKCGIRLEKALLETLAFARQKASEPI